MGKNEIQTCSLIRPLQDVRYFPKLLIPWEKRKVRTVCRPSDQFFLTVTSVNKEPGKLKTVCPVRSMPTSLDTDSLSSNFWPMKCTKRASLPRWHDFGSCVLPLPPGVLGGQEQARGENIAAPVWSLKNTSYRCLLVTELSCNFSG